MRLFFFYLFLNWRGDSVSSNTCQRHRMTCPLKREPIFCGLQKIGYFWHHFIILYLFDAKTAFVCAVLRSFLGSILYGGVTSAVYSVSGAVFAWLMMAISKRMSNGNLTQIGVSVIGAFSHNAAQVFVASVVLSNVWIFTYLPILGVASCITGVFTGYGARYAVKYLEKTGLCRK